MQASKRVEEEPAAAVGKHNILERLYALHRESARDYACLKAEGRQRPNNSLLDRPLELSDWHPLKGPAPTD